MLDFFRKYQRYFFFVIAVVIIVSFAFFGSYSAISSFERKKEIVVGKAVDGSKILYSDIEQLARLLSAENNLVEKEFLKTGVAGRLATAYFEPLKKTWETQFDRAKRYRFYSHSTFAFHNARDLWERFSPGSVKLIEDFQKREAVTPDFFESWAQLYSLQVQCSPEIIKRVLLYQQSQYHIPPDQALLHDSCSLFGLRTMQEWFGRDFLELLSQFVLNGSAIAKQKGYTASRADAQEDLKARIGNLDALQAVGLRKDDAIRLWQKALVFLNYYKDMGSATLTDELAYRRMAEFKGEAAILEVYQPPEELRFRQVDELIAFEGYSRLACKRNANPLKAPEDLLPVETVEKNAPELVSSLYSIRFAEADKRKKGATLSLREIWNWQLQDSHWLELSAAFPEVGVGEDHFALLERLSPAKRSSVDEWTRLRMVDEHPEWIEQQLSQAEVAEKEIFLFSDGSCEGMSIPKNASSFASFIQKSANGNALEAPVRYQLENGKVLSITDVKLVSEKKVLSFAEAKRFNRLNVERTLEQAYSKIRISLPTLFQTESGGWKPLSQVRELAIREIFKDLFSSIDREENISKKQPLEFYCTHRFSHAMREALESLKKDASSNFGLWAIEQSERTSEEFMKEPFILQTGDWSPVFVPPNGEITFYFVKERSVKPSSVLHQIEIGHEVLAADTKRVLAEQLLEVMQRKQAIVLPIRGDE